MKMLLIVLLVVLFCLKRSICLRADEEIPSDPPMSLGSEALLEGRTDSGSELERQTKIIGRVTVAALYRDVSFYNGQISATAQTYFRSITNLKKHTARVKAALMLEGLARKSKRSHALEISFTDAGLELILKTASGGQDKFRANYISEEFVFCEGDTVHFHFQVWETLANFKRWIGGRSNRARTGRNAMYLISCTLDQAALISDFLQDSPQKLDDSELEEGTADEPPSRGTPTERLDAFKSTQEEVLEADLPSLTREECKDHLMTVLHKTWDKFTSVAILNFAEENIIKRDGHATSEELSLESWTAQIEFMDVCKEKIRWKIQSLKHYHRTRGVSKATKKRARPTALLAGERNETEVEGANRKDDALETISMDDKTPRMVFDRRSGETYKCVFNVYMKLYPEDPEITREAFNEWKAKNKK